jgi:hypothetical protein
MSKNSIELYGIRLELTLAISIALAVIAVALIVWPAEVSNRYEVVVNWCDPFDIYDAEQTCGQRSEFRTSTAIVWFSTERIAAAGGTAFASIVLLLLRRTR